ncbi:hypothetical protein MB901379_02009 [Mycobacterium basiliense]|uniref:Uncharacterized protein n=1 Tax=Mycobacterium basiliense TaxID=2094119 RepID=A0A447GD60_9MYCO|nr:hypothetical protein [Mycobacterium basiliense]VDM88447.1 hypothetical protein MB901379_02009 [Mycobacterium basiliense]
MTMPAGVTSFPALRSLADRLGVISAQIASQRLTEPYLALGLDDASANFNEISPEIVASLDTNIVRVSDALRGLAQRIHVTVTSYQQTEERNRAMAHELYTIPE